MRNTTKKKTGRGRAASGAGVLLLTAALVLGGCSATKTAEMSGDASSNESSVGTFSEAGSEETIFTTDRVHTIDVDLDEDEYEEMLSAYAETGDKNWLSVTVTIDGETFEDVGLRLKGNRSLRQALASDWGIELDEDTLEDEERASDSGSSDIANPATIPWLIRLDKYVDDQEYLGRHDFVVRGNDTESYLNEAVAVAMLEEAGLPAHRVGFTSFSVDGGDPVLRLVSEVPDDELWNEEWFGDSGSTWKADSDGDWDYHGQDGADYEDIWKQRTGEDDMTPIVEFMDFINNSSDEEFEEGLESQLDVEQFAKYLAVESLIGNTDTISGPGNNGYLHYDPETGLMTVVAWDHDMVFGGFGAGGPGGAGAPGGGDRGPGGGQMPEGMEPPDGMEPPEGMESPERTEMPEGAEPPGGMKPPNGMEPPEGMEMPEGMELPGGMEMPEGNEGHMGRQNGGGPGGSNILEERFKASTRFNDMYQEAYESLDKDLVESGFALSVLNRYADLLEEEASELLSPETVESDREAIETYLASEEQQPRS